jgi:hypothetical protein
VGSHNAGGAVIDREGTLVGASVYGKADWQGFSYIISASELTSWPNLWPRYDIREYFLSEESRKASVARLAYRQGEMLMEADACEEAALEFSKAFRVDWRTQSAVSLAEALSCAGDHKGALEAFSYAQQLRGMGKALIELGLDSAGAQVLATALQESPYEDPEDCRRAIRSEEYEECEELVYERNSERLETLVYIGRAQYALGHFAEAERTLSEAFILSGGAYHEHLSLWMVRALIAQNKRAEAEDLIRQVAGLYPEAVKRLESELRLRP